jgi:hypothetical protein
MRKTIALATLSALAALVSALPAHAQPEPRGSQTATLPPGHPATTATTAPPLEPGQEEEGLPPGHPQMGAAPGADADEDPHAGADPHAGGSNPHAGGGANPHGGGGGGQMPGVFEPPPDTTDEAADLPPGTIVATIVDERERPIPNTSVTVGIVNNSVAKGESRKHLTRSADARGELRFDGLDTDSHVAYRVTVPKDGATFAASPFRLPEKHGMRVKLHVYPVVHEVEQALIVCQAILYVEMKDDRVQIQEALSIWNFGPVAWVPQNMVLGLPPEYTAFSAQQGMTDTGVDNVEGKGARLRGTFAPGRHDIEFRWQLPYNGERDVIVEAGMPPHLAAARVMAPASKQMTFTATGFPPAQPKTDNQGQRVLISEKQMTRGEPALTTVHLELGDLPTAGPGRYIATILAMLTVATGIALGARKKPDRDRTQEKRDAKEQRKRLLAELEDLERAHRAGDVGPQTYARQRRELVDQIALTYAAA